MLPGHLPNNTHWARCIGRGSYGEVWLARNIMGTYRAVKIVYRATFDSDRPYDREFQGLQKFEPVSRTHESQIAILHVGRNDQEGYFYHVMELADDEQAGQQIDPHQIQSPHNLAIPPDEIPTSQFHLRFPACGRRPTAQRHRQIPQGAIGSP